MRRFVCASVAVAVGMLALAGGSRAAEGTAGEGSQAAWAPPFYAFCVEAGVPNVKPRPLPEQAKMLRDFGFDGAGYSLWFGDELDKNLKVFDGAGLKVYMFHTSINLKNPDQPYDPRVIDAIAGLKGRPATLCVLLVGLPAGDPNGMDTAVKALRELGDAAAKAGIRISIYNHVNNWTESIPFVLEVVKKTDHPSVGANFNLCHWLKVDGAKDYRPLLRENAAKIFAVTICGAQPDAKTWTNGLIQPLDQGSFDNRELLGVLRAAGYRGPIGLMCYGIPGDPADYLARSMRVWKGWKAEWAK